MSSQCMKTLFYSSLFTIIWYYLVWQGKKVLFFPPSNRDVMMCNFLPFMFECLRYNHRTYTWNAEYFRICTWTIQSENTLFGRLFQANCVDYIKIRNITSTISLILLFSNFPVLSTGSCGKSVIFPHLVGFHSSRQNIY